MSVFAVVLREENTEVARRVENRYPGYYQLNDTFFLVQDNGIAETVAKSLGIKGDDRIESASGVVFRLNNIAYSGFTVRSLWDWLQKTEEE